MTVLRVLYTHASAHLAHPFPLLSGDWEVASICGQILRRSRCVDEHRVDAVTCPGCRRTFAEQALARLKPTPAWVTPDSAVPARGRRPLSTQCHGPWLVSRAYASTRSSAPICRGWLDTPVRCFTSTQWAAWRFAKAVRKHEGTP